MYSVLRPGAPRDPRWTPAEESHDSAPPAVAVMPFDGSAAVQAAVRHAADVLADAGHPVTEVVPPHLPEIASAYRNAIATDISMSNYPVIQQLGSAGSKAFLASLMENSTILDVTGYTTTLATRAIHRAA